METDNLNEPLESYSTPATFEQVWKMFQEIGKQIQETDRLLSQRFKETREMFKETDEKFKETDEKFKETDERFKETDEKFKETDEKFKETDRKFKETDKRVKELSALFTSQWGKLVESLVEGDLIKLLNETGIQVERTIQRIKGNHKGQNFEYDIIAVNGAEIVIVEVKTTLRPQDVTDFHEKLWKSKVYMPEYADKLIYGGMAFIMAEGASDRMAEKQGFFVIKATGNSSSIVNQSGFKPKPF
ncbi:MAG: hypothetical protein K9H16_07145 [Bacteroidales bacterium]|nr:hypothetical protein [Bacteroidales bacterium]